MALAFVKYALNAIELRVIGKTRSATVFKVKPFVVSSHDEIVL